MEKDSLRKKIEFHIVYIIIISILVSLPWFYLLTNYHSGLVESLQLELEACEVQLESTNPVKGLKKAIFMLQPRIDPAVANEYAKWILYWSTKYKLPPKLVACVISRESDFDNTVTSSVGAKGPMQVIYKWHKDKCERIGIGEDGLYTIKGGIGVGCEVLREYLNQTGDLHRALIKYVGGQHHQYVNDIFERFAKVSVVKKYTKPEPIVENKKLNATEGNSTKSNSTN